MDYRTKKDGGAKIDLIAVVGETASGKSDLAFKIAKTYRGEVISADSQTVYRSFDIGTAKSTTAQQKAVKHHLLDVRGANSGFNAPMFKQMANEAIADIQKRGKLPILVGGTGLYMDSVLYDYSFLPDVSREERQRSNSLTISQLIKFADKLNISLVDIDTRNKRRIIRAIEAGGAKPTRSKLRPGTLIIGLRTDNEHLKESIETRVDKMLAAGLEAEVKDLSQKYGWDIEPMKGIGYQQWREYFEGEQTWEQTRHRIIAATNQLAKRQRTWFKRNPDVHWFDTPNDAYNFLNSVLNK